MMHQWINVFLVKYAVLLVFFGPGFFSALQAEESKLIQWQSVNAQLLRGYHYKLGAEHRTIGTLEYANAWRYGDFFMFVDHTWPDQGSSTYYGELSPRFSLSKISKRDFSWGPIEDVLIAATVEKPKNQDATYLYGAGFNFDVSGFAYFNTNIYIRNNPALTGKTWQLTWAWKRPFKIGDTSWVTEGFADFAGSEGDASANRLIVPRLLLDLGGLKGNANNRLWLGIEYSYWRNKFGIEGVNESVPQLQVKWVF